MLGHIKPRACRLSPQSKQHYRHLYCSICYSLRTQFGLPASLLINHELTLSLAAFPAYQSMETENKACPAQAFCGQKAIIRDPAIDKAAKLCVLLVWIKLVDWEADRPGYAKTQLRAYLEHKIQPILASLSPATRQFISSYLQLIRAGTPDFSSTVSMSGLLAQFLFQELGERVGVQSNLPAIVELIGKLMTVTDALLDLDKDRQNQQYNPMIAAAHFNQTTLQQEFAQLKREHERLVQHVLRLSEALTESNPVFYELLQQSMRSVTANIERENRALFSVPHDEGQQNRRRNQGRNREKGFCRENCEDSVCDGCCEVCENGCSDGCCCDCGGCDCCGC